MKAPVGVAEAIEDLGERLAGLVLKEKRFPDLAFAPAAAAPVLAPAAVQLSTLGLLLVGAALKMSVASSSSERLEIQRKTQEQAWEIIKSLPEMTDTACRRLMNQIQSAFQGGRSNLYALGLKLLGKKSAIEQPPARSVITSTQGRLRSGRGEPEPGEGPRAPQPQVAVIARVKRDEIQARQDFKVALEAARGANETMVQRQRAGQDGIHRAQGHVANFYWKAAEGRAALAGLKAELSGLRDELQALRALYRQANTPLSELKAAQGRLAQIRMGAGAGGLAPETAGAQAQVKRWATQGQGWRGELSRQINDLAQWYHRANGYVQRLDRGGKAEASELPTTGAGLEEAAIQNAAEAARTALARPLTAVPAMAPVLPEFGGGGRSIVPARPSETGARVGPLKGRTREEIESTALKERAQRLREAQAWVHRQRRNGSESLEELARRAARQFGVAVGEVLSALGPPDLGSDSASGVRAGSGTGTGPVQFWEIGAFPEMEWEQYFAPTPAEQVQREFIARSRLPGSYRMVNSAHDRFSHLIQTANEITTSGPNLTGLIDLILHKITKGGFDPHQFIEKNRAHFFNLFQTDNFDYLVLYVMAQIRHNAKLNHLTVKEFVRRLNTPEGKNLLLQRPTHVPLEAKPR